MHPQPAADRSGLTAEDLAYRRAADAYFEEKGKAARAAFDAKQLEIFLSFEAHWRDFFAPAGGPEALQMYLATPFEVRKAQFERFRRQCKAWEVSFRHCTKGDAARADGNGSSKETGDLRKRLEEQRDKTERVREFYDNLDNLLDRERQKRSHPMELLVHLRALGVSTDATIEDIKKQYKRLAMVHHPDRKGDPLQMSRINDAYRAIVAFYRVA